MSFNDYECDPDFCERYQRELDDRRRRIQGYIHDAVALTVPGIALFLSAYLMEGRAPEHDPCEIAAQLDVPAQIEVSSEVELNSIDNFCDELGDF